MSDIQNQKKASLGEQFVDAVVKAFSSLNGGEIAVTSFQKKLYQNYFYKINSNLQKSELKRMSKPECDREIMSYTWDNVALTNLALDVVAFASIELDPAQPNHINFLPLKNNTTKTIDIGFIIGYKGMEIKAKKYGLEIPDDVVIELVYSTDNFSQFKKDINNQIENYSLQITNNFERGALVGAFWYHQFFDEPKKNKLRVFSLADIKKRMPLYASKEFWGTEKDVIVDGQKTGEKEIVGGWFDEMAYKTISRNGYGAITIDSRKIDSTFLQILEKEETLKIQSGINELEENANKMELDFPAEDNLEIEVQQTEEEPIDSQTLEITPDPNDIDVVQSDVNEAPETDENPEEDIFTKPSFT